MNEGLLVYLWVLYGNLSVIVAIVIFLSTTILSLALFGSMISGMMHTINSGSEEEALHGIDNYSKKEALQFYKFWIFAKRYIKIYVVFIFIAIVLPTRNEAILIFSAPSIVSMAKDGWDSDKMNKIGNILDNSLDYLDKKSEELKENK